MLDYYFFDCFHAKKPNQSFFLDGFFDWMSTPQQMNYLKHFQIEFCNSGFPNSSPPGGKRGKMMKKGEHYRMAPMAETVVKGNGNRAN